MRKNNTISLISGNLESWGRKTADVFGSSKEAFPCFLQMTFGIREDKEEMRDLITRMNFSSLRKLT